MTIITNIKRKKKKEKNYFSNINNNSYIVLAVAGKTSRVKKNDDVRT